MICRETHIVWGFANLIELLFADYLHFILHIHYVKGQKRSFG